MTGSHRSGTGWAGQMLAASGTIGYIWEPFSPLHRPGICDARFPSWFTYVTTENAHLYEGSIRDMLAFRYKLRAEALSLRSPKDFGRLVRDWAGFRRFRRLGLVPLLKDPIAVYSAEWLADTFDVRVIVIARHPAGFAASLKRLGWTHPFQHFLDQDLLMRDWLQPYRNKIKMFVDDERDIVDQSILLWNLVHHAIAAYRERRPDWVFLRLEDLSRNPVSMFAALYRQLELTWTDDVERTIRAHSDESLPATGDAASVKRNSQASASAWRQILTRDEIERVRRGTEAIWTRFYADEDW